MVLVNHDPFALWSASLGRLHSSADRVFRELFPEAMRPAGPRVNLSASDDVVELVAEVPGYAPESLHVRVEEDRLVLEGGAEESAEEGSDAPPRRARFRRAFRLPFAVDAERIEAHLRHGILRVTAPRLAQTAPRSIPVRTEPN